MKKHWFYRLLLSYLPIFLAIVSLLILIFFLSISEIVKKRVQEANDVLARQIMQTIDYSLQSIDQMIVKEVSTDDSLADFLAMSRAQNGYWLNRELSQRLTEITRSYPLIDSMYVYRAADRQILSPTALTEFIRSGDRAFVEDTLARSSVNRWSGVREYGETEDAHPRPVVSLVRKVPTLLDHGFVVVNVHVRAFQEIIDAMSSAQIHQIALTDSRGRLLTRSGAQSGEQVDFSDIAEVAVVESAYTGWKLSSGIAASPLFGFFSVLSSFWIAAGFGVVIAGGLLMIYMTRLNYRPIESIVDRINRYPIRPKQQLSAEYRNEFQYIESALDSLVDQTDQIRKQHQEDLVFKRKHLFAELLEGSRVLSGPQLAAEAEACGLQLQFERLAVAVFEVDKHYELAGHYTPGDLQLFRYIVGRVIVEVAQKQAQSVWCEWTANHRLSVLWLIREGRQDAADSIRRVCEEVRDWVEQNLKFTISAGIGTVEELAEHIPLSGEAAAQALNYKLSLGSNQVILSAEIGELPRGEYFQHLQLIRTMAQKFRLGEAEWEDALRELFRLMENQYLSRGEAAHLMNYLMYHLYLEMQELPADIQAIWKNDALPQFNRLLERFESFDELENDALRLLQSAYNHVKRIREGRYNYNLIHEVRKYIETNYADPNLSLVTLSEEFKLNASYLSRLFKEEFGVKFVDYLSTVRIERAKQLLAQSSRPVQEIANSVGYTHSFSFIRAFKKLTGHTPGDYRKELGF